MKTIRIVREIANHRALSCAWSVLEFEGLTAQYVSSDWTLRGAIERYKARRPTPPPIRAATIGTWTNHSTPEPAPRGRGIIAAHVIACPARFTQTELRAQLKGKVYYGHTVVDVECFAIQYVNKGDRIGLVVDMKEER